MRAVSRTSPITTKTVIKKKLISGSGSNQGVFLERAAGLDGKVSPEGMGALFYNSSGNRDIHSDD
jgi:hypothetical protein